ncbi:hypothetical protein [Tateyamaria sp. SN3-11]|uniref:hypothetical protein n=1 Tax=Tateyamaria sp. SN3-11 TaxID=3092147 RepID=UPI0039EBFC0A
MPMPNPTLTALVVSVSLLTALDAAADAVIAPGAFADHKIILRDAGEQSTRMFALLHGFDSSSTSYNQTVRQLASQFTVILPFAPASRIVQTSAAPRSQASPKAVIEAISRFQSDPDFQSVSVLIDGYEQPLGLRLATAEEVSVAEQIFSFEKERQHKLTQIGSYSEQDLTTKFIGE